MNTSASSFSLSATSRQLSLLAAFMLAFSLFTGLFWTTFAFADETDAQDEVAVEESEITAEIASDAEAATSINAGNWVDPTQRADNSFIYDTTIDALFDEASLYDERTVQIAGEVIGDHIDDTSTKGYGWVQLTSTDDADSSSISVYISDEQARQIDHFGRYGVTGTYLQVRGVYHQACEEHDGLADIHATNSAVLEKGSDHPDEFHLGDFLPGIAALVIGFVLMGIFYFLRERLR